MKALGVECGSCEGHTAAAVCQESSLGCGQQSQPLLPTVACCRRAESSAKWWVRHMYYALLAIVILTEPPVLNQAHGKHEDSDQHIGATRQTGSVAALLQWIGRMHQAVTRVVSRYVSCLFVGLPACKVVCWRALSKHYAHSDSLQHCSAGRTKTGSFESRLSRLLLSSYIVSKRPTHNQRCAAAEGSRSDCADCTSLRTAMCYISSQA